ncbi:MAG: hypothetical protein HY689_05010 [Chloroflexi bacterium]|nr:hypothetical protein [Chloroflexota bacterium]
MHNTLYLLPYTDVPLWVTDRLALDLPEWFDHPVHVLPHHEPPEEAYAPHRGQFLADALLQHMNHLMPRDALKLLGILADDLTTHDTPFIFGQGQRYGRKALISLYRLGHPDLDRCYTRILRQAVHDLGHTFGLEHCLYPACALHPSRSVAELDASPLELCHEHHRALRARTLTRRP